ncbi:DUF1415 domain-containing protein [Bacterioplanes sanyensis]|uniref:DUF1415 domain-containing protein n=1 Tax=Bacterioplanes sanyensis TaxID=1249553 RepID=UPI0012FDC984|nr:DUF1415 domain-containing protein [Bacterioplanes sanyensis]
MLTREWVQQLVIGEGLCPFAAPVFEQLRIDVCAATKLTDITHALVTLLREAAATSPQQLPTALFVVPNALHDFYTYLDWVDVCDQLLVDQGLEGEWQLATFHPRYQFAEEDMDDWSNYSNRSPFPMLHLIREADIEAALADVSHPERIPERNKKHLRRLGREGLLQAAPALAKSGLL